MTFGRASTTLSVTSSSTRRKKDTLSLMMPTFSVAGPAVLPGVDWRAWALLSAGWKPSSGSEPASRLFTADSGRVKSVKSTSPMMEKSMVSVVSSAMGSVPWKK